MGSPKTFIVLVNYNNHDDTLKCLKSLKSAGYENNVVVIDNHSTDPGVDRILTEYPKTVLVKNRENIGFGRANNAGIRWAMENTDCEYIFILNNDTTINTETIPTLEQVLSDDDKTAIATPKIVMMDNPDLLWYGGGEINWRKCSASIPGYLGASANHLADQSRTVTFASGCAMLIKRSIIEKYGGFDDRFFMYIEDLELCIRITNNHQTIAYEANSIVYHKCQGSHRKDKEFFPIDHPKNPNLPFFLYHLNKNRIITIFKHARLKQALQFWTYYPLFMSYKCTQYIIYRRFDAILSIIKGGRDAVKSL